MTYEISMHKITWTYGMYFSLIGVIGNFSAPDAFRHSGWAVLSLMLSCALLMMMLVFTGEALTKINGQKEN